jgi:hypothetical protein
MIFEEMKENAMSRLLGAIVLVGIVSGLLSGQQPPSLPGQTPGKPLDAKSPEAAGQEEASDPYPELRKRAEGLQKIWQQAVKDADQLIPRYYEENRCSKRIEPLIVRKRDAFKKYQEAEELYVRKQVEDALETLRRMETANADNASGSMDYKAEISKVEAEIAGIKSDLAKIPVDDPAYKDAREQLAENLKVDEDTLKHLRKAQEMEAVSVQQLQASIAFVKARKQYTEEMQRNVESFRKETLSAYDADSRVWASRCGTSKDILIKRSTDGKQ